MRFFVVGLKYNAKNGELVKLHGSFPEMGENLGELLRLRQEPENQFDSKAVLVVTSREGTDLPIGHVPKKITTCKNEDCTYVQTEWWLSDQRVKVCPLCLDELFISENFNVEIFELLEDRTPKILVERCDKTHNILLLNLIW